MAERNFVIIGHRAHTAADWKLNDICGGAGRMDILARCVTSALCESHGIRKDTDVWLVLKGSSCQANTCEMSESQNTDVRNEK